MAKCLVIGAGIVGLTTGLKLVEKNNDITIYDCNKVGQASNNAGGIMFPLSPWNDNSKMQELCLSGHKEYNELFTKLSNNERNEINLKKSNLVIVGKNINSSKNWLINNKQIKSEYRNLNIQNIEKNINDSFEEFVLIKNINILDPKKLISFYKNKLVKHGINIINKEISNINRFLEKSENSKYDFIIISSGAWTNNILGSKNIEIKPIKGQTMTFKTKDKVLSNTLIFDDYYIIPRGNNNFLIGSTLEDVGFDEKTTEEAQTIFNETLSKIFSKETNFYDKKYFFGFRPYTDGEPYICKDDRNERLIYNFGHYRYGILTALTSANIVEKMIS
tara:strand:+ start:3177 stop:4175 length:999 start_codon:yes stop_codon:yes gene_type:complete